MKSGIFREYSSFENKNDACLIVDMQKVLLVLKREIQELRDQEDIFLECARQAADRRRMLEEALASEKVAFVKPDECDEHIDVLEERLILAANAAAQLGVSPSTVQRYVANGTLKALQYRPNGPFRIYQSSINQLLGKKNAVP